MRKPANKSAKILTVDQTCTLKENAVGILAGGRKVVLDRFPFVGSIAMSLDLVPTRDCRNPTMSTDGAAIYCDIDFLNGLSNDDMVFIIAHEIYHNVMLHPLRRDNRDHETFNIATDIEVNNLLEQDGMTVPKNACTWAKYNLPKGKSAEEMYDILMDRKKYQQRNNPPKADDGCDMSAPSSGNQEGKLEGQFDKHIYKNEDVEEKGDETLQDSYGQVGYDEDFRPNVTQSSVERVRESAVTAAQSIERKGGTLPSHIKKLVDDLLEPKLNWKDLLAKFITKSNGLKRTWDRPNRRFMSRGLYLPSTYGEKIKVAIGIDTSGSVSSYVQRFLSEVNGLVRTFGEYEITIIQCDTRVQKVDVFSHENPIDLENTKFELEGFGGTKLMPIFEYVKENKLDVDCIAVLTDGHVADKFTAADKPELPVLWCVTKDGNKKLLPFGEITDLDS